MKILKIFGIIVIVAVALLLIVGLLLPSTSHVERTISIEASPKAIFEETNNTKNLNNWSPWAKLDPETKYTFEGPEAGVGAKMSWISEHDQVGEGAQWIIESIENEKVTNQLEFGDFEGDFKASLILEPEGDKTKVTWTYDADMGGNLIGKYFGLFMDGMLGPFYEDGLSNLKEVAESKPVYTVEISEEDISTQNYIGLKSYVKWEDLDQMSAKIGAAYGKVGAYMQKNGIEMAGMPIALYSDWEEGVGFNMECAMRVADAVSVNDRNLNAGVILAGKSVKAIHMGSYDGLKTTYDEVRRYMADKGYGDFSSSWEVYATDPGAEPDTAKWVTHVFVALN